MNPSRRLAPWLLLPLVLLVGRAAPAQPFELPVRLVKDIRPGPGGSLFLFTSVNVNGALLFAAFDGIHGHELWKSDGTAAGTVLVKDINPGAGFTNFNNLTDVNGRLFFVADDGTTGFEL
jgi:ELWxxDGT repeat protein